MGLKNKEEATTYTAATYILAFSFSPTTTTMHHHDAGENLFHVQKWWRSNNHEELSKNDLTGQKKPTDDCQPSKNNTIGSTQQ